MTNYFVPTETQTREQAQDRLDDLSRYGVFFQRIEFDPESGGVISTNIPAVEVLEVEQDG